MINSYKIYIFFSLLMHCISGTCEESTPNTVPQDPMINCVKNLIADRKDISFFNKFPLDISKGQSLDILSDSSKITTKDKPFLKSFMDEGEKCKVLGDEFRHKNYPASITNLMDSYFIDAKSSIADFYSGKLTFGEIAKIREKNLTNFKNSLNVIVQDLLKEEQKQVELKKQAENIAQQKRELDLDASRKRQADYEQAKSIQQAQADAARRQFALQYFLGQQRPVQIQQIAPIQFNPSPTYNTNCTANGNQMNCTTR